MSEKPSPGISTQVRRLRKLAAGPQQRQSRRVSRTSPVRTARSEAEARAALDAWFAEQGWIPRSFQRQAWAAYLRGESGLLHIPTGAGKTLAAIGGPLIELARRPESQGLRLLFVTPLKAAARDAAKAIQRAASAVVGPGTLVGTRTGDTPSSERERQRRHPPQILLTTPESLALLACESNASEMFASLDGVVIDEWHELIATKRGTLLELALARTRALAPKARTWALTATIANLEEAALAATGVPLEGVVPTVISAKKPRPLEIETLLPPSALEMAWAWGAGTAMAPTLARLLDPALPTLIFCNARSAAERWRQALVDARPEWRELIGLHHGSLDVAERERVEAGAKDGSLPFVVCTSSLDLGVDFAAIERAAQIGSPKALARLVQRAGRSAHRPGESARLIFVPTQAWELAEIAAARRAIARGDIEPREPLHEPIDALIQHAVSRSLGKGFMPDELYAEVRTAWSYRHLSRERFDQAIAVATIGGPALAAYPAYRRVRIEGDGRRVIYDAQSARMHRLNSGSILSNSAVDVSYVTGGRIGSVEEAFIAKLKPGDRFLFSGRVLELVRLSGLRATVRAAKGLAEASPTWLGGRLPYSSSLAQAVREILEEARDGVSSSIETDKLVALIETQRRLSRIPGRDQLLIEAWRARDGAHLYVYPFEGRPLHEGMAATIALRLARRQKATFALTANDYGFALSCPQRDYPFAKMINSDLFNADGAEQDAAEAANMAELAKAQFREIARVSGLTPQAFPGNEKSSRQLQASAGLLFDVLSRHDPEHPLLGQARDQAMDALTERGWLSKSLKRLQHAELLPTVITQPTPLSFPLLAARMGERARGRISTESLAERLARIQARWTEPASTPPGKRRIKK